MARPLRVEFAGAFYHGMNRGASRQRVFLDEGDFDRFLQLLRDVSEIFRVEVHAYCLMDNHYHLLVRTPEANLGSAMRHLNGVYTQYLNRRTGRDGPLFRGRYQAVLIDSDAYLLQVSRYIHLNPVDAGVVDRPEHYVHSSYRAYLRPRAAPHWLFTRTLLDHFEPQDAPEEYHRFVQEGLDAETLAFYKNERAAPVLGRDSFKKTVQLRLETAGEIGNRELPDARRVRPRPGLAAIVAAVAAAFGVDPTSPNPGKRSRNVVLARSVALHLARHEAGISLGSAAARLGYRSYNSAATASTRLRRRLGEPELEDRLRQARAHLYKVET